MIHFFDLPIFRIFQMCKKVVPASEGQQFFEYFSLNPLRIGR